MSSFGWPEAVIIIIIISLAVIGVAAIVRAWGRGNRKRGSDRSQGKIPDNGSEFCRKCGVKLQKDDDFCPKCGTTAK